MKPKYITLLLAVALFAACNKEKIINPDKPEHPVETVKFASIVGKWLLTGSARTTVHYTNSGRDSTVKTDSLYNYDYLHPIYGGETINTYNADNTYSTQDYGRDGTSEYPAETATYSISGNTITYITTKGNYKTVAKIITLDEKILRISQTDILEGGDKTTLNVSLKRQ
ncbi:MAG: lipocalin family protein [Mucilaginibacter sp.]|uniref:lipocalin family protein n=1 Tax=Mucilaginibacter sp. TaxID=1882438 RepID=UPI0031B2112F